MPLSDADASLIHDLAATHPEVTTLAAAGVLRVEQAAGKGLVPLGLPLPGGKRDLLVPAERRDAVQVEIAGMVDRARRRDAVLAQGRRALAGWRVALLTAPDRTRIRAVMSGDLPWPGLPAPVRLTVERSVDTLELAGLDDDELALRLDGDPALTRALDHALSRTAAALRRYAGAADGGEGEWGLKALADRLHRAARNRTEVDALLDRWDGEFTRWRRERAEALGRLHVERHFDMTRFERLFPVARGMGRRLVLITGPTNSGKTHRALEALKAAHDGVYLAPLRLLALEVMERLTDAGTPTDLLTGEEVRRTPGARHTASTVEVMDPDRPVDVAVIDEIQMLADPGRGWAWTAALVGVPAATVYILGAPEARPLVERAAAHLNEPLEIIELERKAPLSLIPRRLEWEDVARGDALIAFSRREVHSVRDTLLARGLSVATVYGALAPAVRRREAARFTSGEADVVVATDAIGMGLNLPCRRVLFTALEKYDGTTVRPLTASEVRQIAGRAGRFGHFDEGEFGVVARGTPQALRTLMDKPDVRLRPDRPLPVRPSRAMLARLAEHLGTEEAGLLLRCFAQARTAGTSTTPFRLSDVAPLLRLAALLDARRLALPVKLDLLLVPADLDEASDAALVTAILDAVESGTPLPLSRVIPARLDGLDAEALEGLTRALDLYHWAARKLPHLLPDRERVAALRDTVGRRLSEILSSRARRRPPDPPAGFRGAPRKRFGPRRR